MKKKKHKKFIEKVVYVFPLLNESVLRFGLENFSILYVHATIITQRAQTVVWLGEKLYTSLLLVYRKQPASVSVSPYRFFYFISLMQLIFVITIFSRSLYVTKKFL